MKMGGALGKVGNFYKNTYKALGDGRVFGSKSDAGILGTGQFKTGGPTKIDDTAFTDETRSNQRRGEFAKALENDSRRTGATMEAAASGRTTIDQGGANAWEARQKGLADNLQAQMEGRGGPSLAEMQMSRGMNQSLANANAQAASMRGMNPAMALRTTQANAMNAQQDNIGQTGMLRAQEQQSARQQFGDLSTNARGQSADMATNQARMNQETELSNTAATNAARANNQNAEMGQRGLNDAASKSHREGMMTIDERDRQAKMDLGKLRVNESVGQAGINAGAYQAAASNRQGMIGGIGQGVAAMLSDINAKTNISKIDPDEGSSNRLSTNLKDWATKSSKQESKTNAEAMGSGLGAVMKASVGSGAAGGASSGLGGAAGMAGMFASDINNKKDIRKFADSLEAYKYNYKNPEKHGHGEQTGIMAQDLEKTPLGSELVENTPDGKMVDIGKAGGVILATQAMQNDRLAELEKAFASRKARG